VTENTKCVCVMLAPQTGFSEVEIENVVSEDGLAFGFGAPISYSQSGSKFNLEGIRHLRLCNVRSPPFMEVLSETHSSTLSHPFP